MIRWKSAQLVLARAVLAITITAVSAIPARAQGFGGFGGGSPDDLFYRLDRDGDDEIEPEEWETAPTPLRRMFEDRGADLARSMRIEQYRDIFQALREDMMGRMNGGFSRGSFDGGRRGRDDRGGPFEGDFGRGRRGSDEDSPPDTGTSSGKHEEKAASKSPAPRMKMTVKLPDQYRDRDKNKDNQIGLYEWPRTDYAGFRKLDLNGDGFLTPQELLRGPRVTVASRSAAPSTSASSASPSPPVAAVARSSPGSPAPTGPRKPEETAFDLLDKDKDGMISETEWGRSLLAKKKFEAAGIAVQFPLSRTEFYRHYPTAYASTGK